MHLLGSSVRSRLWWFSRTGGTAQGLGSPASGLGNLVVGQLQGCIRSCAAACSLAIAWAIRTCLHLIDPVSRPRCVSACRQQRRTCRSDLAAFALVCWSLAVSRSCATGVSCPTGRLYPSESVGLCVAPFCCAVGESVTRAAQARLSPPSRHVRIWRSSPQRPTQPSPTATWTWNGCLPCSQPAQNHPTRPTTRTRQR